LAVAEGVGTARPRIACVIGTRPEAIKMAPVVTRLREAAWSEVLVVATAQHRGLLDQALAPFAIVPDVDLDLMTEGQALPALCGRMIPALAQAFRETGVSVVLAQGDTATVFCAGVAAYLAELPFGHVEAGLRTGNLAEPFPEEGFRQMVARIARWHFAPTVGAGAHLAAEGLPAERIHVTGNTGIDALLSVRAGRAPSPRSGATRRLLLTAHRRESFGAPLSRVFEAVRALVEERPELEVTYPVHPNPQVTGAAQRLLAGHPRIGLVEPLDYLRFTDALADCDLVLTDSGGIQEEAPALGKPVLVARDRTERPEAVDAGVARLVGTDPDRIREEVLRLLDDPAHYAAMARGGSPYGDGHAAERIEAQLRRDLGA
jgi:UDP-N-acetylglucosamine 2-epimerase (non-hydrolysing)